MVQKIRICNIIIITITGIIYVRREAGKKEKKIARITTISARTTTRMRLQWVSIPSLSTGGAYLPSQWVVEPNAQKLVPSSGLVDTETSSLFSSLFSSWLYNGIRCTYQPPLIKNGGLLSPFGMRKSLYGEQEWSKRTGTSPGSTVGNTEKKDTKEEISNNGGTVPSCTLEATATTTSSSSRKSSRAGQVSSSTTTSSSSSSSPPPPPPPLVRNRFSIFFGEFFIPLFHKEKENSFFKEGDGFRRIEVKEVEDAIRERFTQRWRCNEKEKKKEDEEGITGSKERAVNREEGFSRSCSSSACIIGEKNEEKKDGEDHFLPSTFSPSVLFPLPRRECFFIPHVQELLPSMVSPTNPTYFLLHSHQIFLVTVWVEVREVWSVTDKGSHLSSSSSSACIAEEMEKGAGMVQRKEEKEEEIGKGLSSLGFISTGRRNPPAGGEGREEEGERRRGGGENGTEYPNDLVKGWLRTILLRNSPLYTTTTTRFTCTENISNIQASSFLSTPELGLASKFHCIHSLEVAKGGKVGGGGVYPVTCVGPPWGENFFRASLLLRREVGKGWWWGARSRDSSTNDHVRGTAAGNGEGGVGVGLSLLVLPIGEEGRMRMGEVEWRRWWRRRWESVQSSRRLKERAREEMKPWENSSTAAPETMEMRHGRHRRIAEDEKRGEKKLPYHQLHPRLQRSPARGLVPPQQQQGEGDNSEPSSSSWASPPHGGESLYDSGWEIPQPPREKSREDLRAKDTSLPPFPSSTYVISHFSLYGVYYLPLPATARPFSSSRPIYVCELPLGNEYSMYSYESVEASLEKMVYRILSSASSSSTSTACADGCGHSAMKGEKGEQERKEGGLSRGWVLLKYVPPPSPDFLAPYFGEICEGEEKEEERDTEESEEEQAEEENGKKERSIDEGEEEQVEVEEEKDHKEKEEEKEEELKWNASSFLEYFHFRYFSPQTLLRECFPSSSSSGEIEQRQRLRASEWRRGTLYFLIYKEKKTKRSFPFSAEKEGSTEKRNNLEQAAAAGGGVIEDSGEERIFSQKVREEEKGKVEEEDEGEVLSMVLRLIPPSLGSRKAIILIVPMDTEGVIVEDEEEVQQDHQKQGVGDSRSSRSSSRRGRKPTTRMVLPSLSLPASRYPSSSFFSQYVSLFYVLHFLCRCDIEFPRDSIWSSLPLEMERVRQQTASLAKGTTTTTTTTRTGTAVAEISATSSSISSTNRTTRTSSSSSSLHQSITGKLTEVENKNKKNGEEEEGKRERTVHFYRQGELVLGVQIQQEEARFTRRNSSDSPGLTSTTTRTTSMGKTTLCDHRERGKEEEEEEREGRRLVVVPTPSSCLTTFGSLTVYYSFPFSLETNAILNSSSSCPSKPVSSTEQPLREGKEGEGGGQVDMNQSATPGETRNEGEWGTSTTMGGGGGGTPTTTSSSSSAAPRTPYVTMMGVAVVCTLLKDGRSPREYLEYIVSESKLELARTTPPWNRCKPTLQNACSITRCPPSSPSLGSGHAPPPTGREGERNEGIFPSLESTWIAESLLHSSFSSFSSGSSSRWPSGRGRIENSFSLGDGRMWVGGAAYRAGVGNGGGKSNGKVATAGVWMRVVEPCPPSPNRYLSPMVKVETKERKDRGEKDKKAAGVAGGVFPTVTTINTSSEAFRRGEKSNNYNNELAGKSASLRKRIWRGEKLMIAQECGSGALFIIQVVIRRPSGEEEEDERRKRNGGDCRNDSFSSSAMGEAIRSEVLQWVTKNIYVGRCSSPSFSTPHYY